MLGDLRTAVMTRTLPMTLPTMTRAYKVGRRYIAKSGTAWLSMMSWEKQVGTCINNRTDRYCRVFGLFGMCNVVNVVVQQLLVCRFKSPSRLDKSLWLELWRRCHKQFLSWHNCYSYWLKLVIWLVTSNQSTCYNFVWHRRLPWTI